MLRLLRLLRRLRRLLLGFLPHVLKSGKDFDCPQDDRITPADLAMDILVGRISELGPHGLKITSELNRFRVVLAHDLVSARAFVILDEVSDDALKHHRAACSV